MEWGTSEEVVQKNILIPYKKHMYRLSLFTASRGAYSERLHQYFQIYIIRERT